MTSRLVGLRNRLTAARRMGQGDQRRPGVRGSRITVAVLLSAPSAIILLLCAPLLVVATLLSVGANAQAPPAGDGNVSQPRPATAAPKSPIKVGLFSSGLQRAIARGMTEGADLSRELLPLMNESIDSKSDAKTICEALSYLPELELSAAERKRQGHLRLDELASLFYRAEDDSPADEVLKEEGITQLMRIFDAMLPDADQETADELLSVLRIGMLYESRDAAERVVAAARKRVNPDSVLWFTVFSPLRAEEHAQRDFIFESLSDPLPKGSVAAALLDMANQAGLHGQLKRHPFNHEAGWKQLRVWLTDPDPDHFAFAVSGAASLPFISSPVRDDLLAVAMQHKSAEVQMEGAWAAAKVGKEAGLDRLAEFCKQLEYTETAQAYLSDVEHEDRIPAEAKDPEFAAKAEFVSWLAHPNELGKMPDEVEVIDHRELSWPPEREMQSVWVLRYRVRDRTGLEDDDVECGVVGHVTWCFFGFQMNQRPPEDIYAIQCSWELEQLDLYTQKEVNPDKYQKLLEQWTGGPLEAPRVTNVVTLDRALEAPNRRFGIATASRDGQPGWVVLDGERSAWYPQAEQPSETNAENVLRIHIGRQLLNLTDAVDRKAFLAPPATVRSPAQIVTAYERLLAEARSSSKDRQEELLAEPSVLQRKFDDYVAAAATVRGKAKSLVTIETYEQVLRMADDADKSTRESMYNIRGLIVEEFDAYVAALIEQGRADHVGRVCQSLAPHCDHPFGHAMLGRATFKAQLWKDAEAYLVKLYEREHAERDPTMELLCQLWHQRGEVDRAQELLLNRLRSLASEHSDKANKPRQQELSGAYRQARQLYQQLFPDGANALQQHHLPESLE